MTRGVCTIMKTTILLLTLVLLDMAFAAYIPPVEISAKGLRRIRRSQYCSSNLSNVLAVLCREHGYNEPFSHRDNQQSYSPPGPGLVEECCHRSCTLEQLQLYCKAPSEKKSDIMWVNSYIKSFWPPFRGSITFLFDVDRSAIEAESTCGNGKRWQRWCQRKILMNLNNGDDQCSPKFVTSKFSRQISTRVSHL